MPVAILGDRSCGKTIFLCMLNEAAVRYGARLEKEGKSDAFRFIAEPQFVKVIGDMRTAMSNKSWPASTLKGRLWKYRFTFGYKKPMQTGLKPADLYYRVDFSVYDVAGEDVEIQKSLDLYTNRMRSSGEQFGDFDIEKLTDLSPSFKQLLDCNVLVFLLDLQKISIDRNSEKFKEMLDYDIFMATLISAVAYHKARLYSNVTDKNLAKIYPVFVFTKYDAMDKSILKALDLPTSLSALKSEDDLMGKLKGLVSSKDGRMTTREFSEKIMSTYYNDTLALSRGGRLVNVDFDKAGFFLSAITTELNEEGIEVPKVEMVNGVEPRLVFSDQQYYDFIDYFRRIASGMKENVKQEQDFKKRV